MGKISSKIVHCLLCHKYVDGLQTKLPKASVVTVCTSLSMNFWQSSLNVSTKFVDLKFNSEQAELSIQLLYCQAHHKKTSKAKYQLQDIFLIYQILRAFVNYCMVISNEGEFYVQYYLSYNICRFFSDCSLSEP